MIRESNYNGANFSNIEVCNEIVCTCTAKERISMKGNLSLNRLNNAFKFEDEIQIQVYGSEFKIEPRANNNGKWNRIEIYIPLDKIDLLISKLEYLKAGEKMRC